MTPEQTDATLEAERRAKAWDDHLRARLVYEEFDDDSRSHLHPAAARPVSQLGAAG